MQVWQWKVGVFNTGTASAKDRVEGKRQRDSRGQKEDVYVRNTGQRAEGSELSWESLKGAYEVTWRESLVLIL